MQPTELPPVPTRWACVRCRNAPGRPDRRLRVIYDNGTESDLLLRSLQRALNKDKSSRRITAASLGPLFSDKEEENDLPSGTIYILRSKSDHPFVAQNREVLHKIGVTGGRYPQGLLRPRKTPRSSWLVSKSSRLSNSPISIGIGWSVCCTSSSLPHDWIWS